MLRKLFNAPWPDEVNLLPDAVQQQAAQRIYADWRSRGWQLVLGEWVLAAAAIRWHLDGEGAYLVLSGFITLTYLLGLIPQFQVLWLTGTVILFMIQGMFIDGLGAVTALSFMLPYTFAGMLLSGRRRLTVQAFCVIAFWISLMYEILPLFVQLNPPRYILVSYNILLAAYTFQSLRFLNQLAVEINTVYVEDKVQQQSQQFLARVSHELRTPLNSVLGFAKMLRRAELSEAHQTYLNTIIDEGEQLNRLVSDLLDSAHLSTGKLTLNLEPCNINDICEVVAEEHRHNLSNQLTLQMELMPNLPVTQGDPVRLRQCIGNLVSNAIKHTGQGEITIKTYRHEQQVMIDISDTGAGISEEQQKLIFIPFVQMDNRSAGVGLGLDIARQLVRLHGGELTVSSKLSEGSTFTMILPITSS